LAKTKVGRVTVSYYERLCTLRKSRYLKCSDSSLLLIEPKRTMLYS